jgi:hypothetical protein
MPLPVIAGVARCAVSGVAATGQPWVNVIHLQKEGGISVLDFPDILNTVSHLYDSAGGGTIAHGHGFYAADPDEATQLVITPLDGVSASGVFVLALAGTSGQQALPGECAVICSHTTGTRGKSHRGRTFWSSPYEGMTDADGSLTASIGADIRDTWNAFRDDLATNDLFHVVASYKLETFDVITDTIVRDYFGHQDRRRN